MEGVTIVICCYNSSLRLKQTLKFITEQKISNTLSWEVILVDNNSTDCTAASAQEIWLALNCSIPFKTVCEDKAGLSFARGKGISEAHFEFIIFCDDDNWLDENYVQTAYDFLSTNQGYAAIGGASEAAFEEGMIVPEWFTENATAYAVGNQQVEEGDITLRGHLWGAGIAFRKSIYNQVINNSLPSLLSDRKGHELSSGGDTELCLRFIVVGYRLYYTDRLKFKHFISPERLTVEYRVKLLAGLEMTGEVLNKYFFYINVNKNSDKIKQQINLFFKYWLYILKIRKLSIIDKRLILALTYYKLNEIDQGYELIRTLKKLKVSMNQTICF